MVGSASPVVVASVVEWVVLEEATNRHHLVVAVRLLVEVAIRAVLVEEAEEE